MKFSHETKAVAKVIFDAVNVEQGDKALEYLTNLATALAEAQGMEAVEAVNEFRRLFNTYHVRGCYSK